MSKTPFRIWRERNGLTQEQAAKILDRSKRSVEMLDQAAMMDPELDYACRWIERYVIPEQFAPVAHRLLGHEDEGGFEYVQHDAQCFYGFDLHDERIAAAEKAFQRLKDKKGAAQENYQKRVSALLAWLERVDEFVETEEPHCDVKEPPPLPSRSISTADVLGAAWEVVKANAAVKGGERALTAEQEFDLHEKDEGQDGHEEEE